nr:uncharacterized protein LOC128686407 [Cherax quadricarinatus]
MSNLRAQVLAVVLSLVVFTLCFCFIYNGTESSLLSKPIFQTLTNSLPAAVWGTRRQETVEGRGEDTDQASVEEQHQASGDDKDQASGEDNDQASGDDKDQASGEDNDQASGEDNDQASGEDKDQASGEDKDLASGKDKDLASGKDKDLAAGLDKDQASGEDKDLASGEDKDQASGEDKDQARDKDRKQEQKPGKKGNENRNQARGEDKKKARGKDNRKQARGDDNKKMRGNKNRNQSRDEGKVQRRGDEDKNKARGKDKNQARGEDKDQARGEDKDQARGEDKEQVRVHEDKAGSSKTYGQLHTHTPAENQTWKIILFWDQWFGGDWSNRFGTTTSSGLREEGCPSWRCNFTYDHSLLGQAHAVLFRALAYPWESLPTQRVPREQRWVLVDVEAPPSQAFSRQASSLLNWTMTYHTQSDVVAFNGYFLSLGASLRPLRPNQMSEHGEAVGRLKKALARGVTLEEVLGPSWVTYVNKPRVVAWMSGHCSTRSKREQYVAKLKQYLSVDTYGECGRLKCGPKSIMGGACWVNVMQPNYSFYLSMENAFCDDYITEKLYNPIVHNIVPIVWGGANYTRYLPPHSYIDARRYHPSELAALLLRLHNDPVAYGRYHVWRGFLRPFLKGSLCELCHKVHTNTTFHHYQHLPTTRRLRGRCTVVPSPLFNPDHPDSWKAYITTNYTDLNRTRKAYITTNYTDLNRTRRGSAPLLKT